MSRADLPCMDLMSALRPGGPFGPVARPCSLDRWLGASPIHAPGSRGEGEQGEEGAEASARQGLPRGQGTGFRRRRG
jgi:hypothetical protein